MENELLSASTNSDKSAPLPKSEAPGQIPRYPEGYSPPRRGAKGVPRRFETFEGFSGSLAAIEASQLNSWLEAADVQALSAIEWTWLESWGVGPRRINDSMWFWFESGAGQGWIGSPENSFRFASGDLILIPQNAEHALRQDEGVESCVTAVHFHAKMFGGISLLNLLGFPVHIGGEPIYADSSQRLAREFAVKAPGWSAAMRTTIFETLLYIVRHHGKNFRTFDAQRAQAELPRLLPALELIDEKLHDSTFTVGELAGSVFLGEVQFRKIFRRVTGMSPQQFVQRRRVERACALLLETEMSVEHIAETCGFYTPSFFHRVFKWWMHTSPARYRRAVRTVGLPFEIWT